MHRFSTYHLLSFYSLFILIFTSSTIVAQTEKTVTIKVIILDGEEE